MENFFARYSNLKSGIPKPANDINLALQEKRKDNVEAMRVARQKERVSIEERERKTQQKVQSLQGEIQKEQNEGKELAAAFVIIEKEYSRRVLNEPNSSACLNSMQVCEEEVDHLVSKISHTVREFEDVSNQAIATSSEKLEKNFSTEINRLLGVDGKNTEYLDEVRRQSAELRAELVQQQAAAGQKLADANDENKTLLAELEQFKKQVAAAEDSKRLKRLELEKLSKQNEETRQRGTTEEENMTGVFGSLSNKAKDHNDQVHEGMRSVLLKEVSSMKEKDTTRSSVKQKKHQLVDYNNKMSDAMQTIKDLEKICDGLAQGVEKKKGFYEENKNTNGVKAEQETSSIETTRSKLKVLQDEVIQLNKKTDQLAMVLEGKPPTVFEEQHVEMPARRTDDDFQQIRDTLPPVLRKSTRHSIDIFAEVIKAPQQGHYATPPILNPGVSLTNFNPASTSTPLPIPIRARKQQPSRRGRPAAQPNKKVSGRGKGKQRK